MPYAHGGRRASSVRRSSRHHEPLVSCVPRSESAYRYPGTDYVPPPTPASASSTPGTRPLATARHSQTFRTIVKGSVAAAAAAATTEEQRHGQTRRERTLHKHQSRLAARILTGQPLQKQQQALSTLLQPSSATTTSWSRGTATAMTTVASTAAITSIATGITNDAALRHYQQKPQPLQQQQQQQQQQHVSPSPHHEQQQHQRRATTRPFTAGPMRPKYRPTSQEQQQQHRQQQRQPPRSASSLSCVDVYAEHRDDEADKHGDDDCGTVLDRACSPESNTDGTNHADHKGNSSDDVLVVESVPSYAQPSRMWCESSGRDLSVYTRNALLPSPHTRNGGNNTGGKSGRTRPRSALLSHRSSRATGNVPRRSSSRAGGESARATRMLVPVTTVTNTGPSAATAVTGTPNAMLAARTATEVAKAVLDIDIGTNAVDESDNRDANDIGDSGGGSDVENQNPNQSNGKTQEEQSTIDGDAGGESMQFEAQSSSPSHARSASSSSTISSSSSWSSLRKSSKKKRKSQRSAKVYFDKHGHELAFTPSHVLEAEAAAEAAREQKREARRERERVKAEAEAAAAAVAAEAAAAEEVTVAAAAAVAKESVDATRVAQSAAETAATATADRSADTTNAATTPTATTNVSSTSPLASPRSDDNDYLNRSLGDNEDEWKFVKLDKLLAGAADLSVDFGEASSSSTSVPPLGFQPNVDDGDSSRHATIGDLDSDDDDNNDSKAIDGIVVAMTPLRGLVDDAVIYNGGASGNESGGETDRRMQQKWMEHNHTSAAAVAQQKQQQQRQQRRRSRPSTAGPMRRRDSLVQQQLYYAEAMRAKSPTATLMLQQRRLKNKHDMTVPMLLREQRVDVTQQLHKQQELQRTRMLRARVIELRDVEKDNAALRTHVAQLEQEMAAMAEHQRECERYVEQNKHLQHTVSVAVNSSAAAQDAKATADVRAKVLTKRLISLTQENIRMQRQEAQSSIREERNTKKLLNVQEKYQKLTSYLEVRRRENDRLASKLESANKVVQNQKARLETMKEAVAYANKDAKEHATTARELKRVSERLTRERDTLQECDDNSQRVIRKLESQIEELGVQKQGTTKVYNQLHESNKQLVAACAELKQKDARNTQVLADNAREMAQQLAQIKDLTKSVAVTRQELSTTRSHMQTYRDKVTTAEDAVASYLAKYDALLLEHQELRLRAREEQEARERERAQGVSLKDLDDGGDDGDGEGDMHFHHLTEDDLTEIRQNVRERSARDLIAFVARQQDELKRKVMTVSQLTRDTGTLFKRNADLAKANNAFVVSQREAAAAMSAKESECAKLRDELMAERLALSTATKQRGADLAEIAALERQTTTLTARVHELKKEIERLNSGIHMVGHNADGSNIDASLTNQWVQPYTHETTHESSGHRHHTFDAEADNGDDHTPMRSNSSGLQPESTDVDGASNAVDGDMRVIASDRSNNSDIHSSNSFNSSNGNSGNSAIDSGSATDRINSERPRHRRSHSTEAYIASLKDHLTSHQVKIDNLTRQLDAAGAAVVAAEEKSTALMLDIETATSKADTAEAKLQEAQAAIAEYKTQLSSDAGNDLLHAAAAHKYELRIESLEQSVTGLTQENKRYAIDVEEARAQVATLNTRLLCDNEQRQVYQNDLEALRAEVERGEQKLMKVAVERDIALSVGATLKEQEVPALQASLQSLTEQHDATNVQLVRVRQQHSDAVERADGLQRERAELRVQVTSLTEQVASLNEQLKTLQVDKDALEIKSAYADTFAERIADAHTVLEGDRQERARLYEQIHVKDDENMRLAKVNTEKQDEILVIEQQKAQIASLLAQTEGRLAEVDSLKKQLGEANAYKYSYNDAVKKLERAQKQLVELQSSRR